MCVKFRSQWVCLVSHPLSLIKDKLYVLSFPLPTTPPGRLLPSKHAPVRGWYWHGTGSTNTARPTIGGTGTQGAPYIYRTGCTRGNVRAPHHAHTVPGTDPVPFCPYRPHTVLPVPAPYRFAPVLSLQAITNPYRPRTVLPLQINCYIRAIKCWFRLLKMDSERLPNQAFRC